MPTASDISFNCPHCQGPLMAELSQVGMSCDCPHCYAQFQIPEGGAVNKDKFVEPTGLRRILKQVRDQEWEVFRRKLRAAKAHGAELEAELHRVQAALAERAAAPELSDEKAVEVAALRKQLTELGDQFAQANQAFIAGRKQQDSVVEHFRRELEAARLETAVFKKKNEELARLVQGAREEIMKARDAKSGEHFAELERLRAELVETRSKLDAEEAKVLVMEAAGISTDLPVHGEAASDKNDAQLQELQIQIADLLKSNISLRAARDKAHAELTELKDRLSVEDNENLELQMALSHLEEGMTEVVELIAARRSIAMKRA